MYSQRYGTIPIVRRTGGLQDTVVDANADNTKTGTATGFVFEEATASGLTAAVRRALSLWKDPILWRQLMLTGMQRDFSWRRSANEYLQLYAQALTDPLSAPDAAGR
jgi:starch synthase